MRQRSKCECVPHSREASDVQTMERKVQRKTRKEKEQARKEERSRQGIPPSKERLLNDRNLKKVREHWELASRGMFKCQGSCGRELPLADGLIIQFRGNILYGICMDCFPKDPISITQVQREYGPSIWVGKLRDMEKRTGVSATPISNLLSGTRALNEMEHIQKQTGLVARQRRVDFPTED